MKCIKKLFFILLLTSFGVNARAGSVSLKIDSLRALLPLTHSDSELFRICSNLGWSYKNISVDSALFYENKAMLISRKMRSDTRIAMSYNHLGVITWINGDYNNALSNTLNALRLYEKLGYQKEMSDEFTNLGLIYSDLKKFDDALRYSKQALKLRQELGDQALVGTAYQNLGYVYFKKGELDMALEHFISASRIMEKISDKAGLSGIYMNIAAIGQMRKMPDVALRYYENALKIDREMDNKLAICQVYSNIILLYMEMKDFSRAKTCLDEYERLAKELKSKQVLSEYYTDASTWFEKQGRAQEALDGFKLAQAYADSELDEQKNKEMAEMQTKYETEKKEQSIRIQQGQLNSQASEIKSQRIFNYSAILVLLLGSTLSFFIYKNYREKKKANQQLTLQNEIIASKNKETQDSLHYATRIQRALMASDKLLKKNLPDHFILYKPKDIVSGDFYWAVNIEGEQKFLLVTADCTGHGVPGAFMSLLNIGKLSETVSEKKITDPGKILDTVRDEIIRVLNPEGSTHETQDGMDGLVCSFDLKNGRLKYAGANSSFYCVREGNLTKYMTDNMPVGKSPREHLPFSQWEIEIKKGDIIYSFTDGVADQFGGEKGKKFKYKQLQEVLLKNTSLPMKEQKEKLEQVIEAWTGELEQVDDILVIAVKV